jgi:Tfp pilus assembly protein PilF
VLAPVLRQQVPERFRELLTRRIEEYAQTLSVTAERPESHLNLGLVASAVGDAAQAEQSYQTALRLQPDFAPAYANLADLYRALGRDDDGEVHLRAGIAAAPDSAALSYALGLLLIREQRLPEALPQLARAVALAPSEPRYPFVQALALEQAGETDQAREVLREAVQHHPNDADIRAALERLAEK